MNLEMKTAANDGYKPAQQLWLSSEINEFLKEPQFSPTATIEWLDILGLLHKFPVSPSQVELDKLKEPMPSILTLRTAYHRWAVGQNLKGRVAIPFFKLLIEHRYLKRLIYGD